MSAPTGVISVAHCDFNSSYPVDMVVSDKGVLIECDPQMKQFILYLDDKQPAGSKLVLKDLDATHVFVESKYVELIKTQIDDLMEQVNYAEQT